MWTPWNLLATLILLTLLSTDDAAGESPPTSCPPSPHKLVVSTVYGAEGTEQVIVIVSPHGGASVTTPEKLHDLIGIVVPGGSTLEFASSCTGTRDEPLRTTAELESLAKFCQAKGIRFVHHPAG